ncbi:MAG: adenylate kinase [Flavobacteriaceae bacterium]|nr:MAG: adenylate kinase [Flavobacteriaceae bacterium]
MFYLVVFGPPGAGKGTQSDKIIEKYGFAHISTGDVFRANMQEKTELGILAQDYINKGELVPDALTIDMLIKEVAKFPDAKGVILDGFPRTVPQAEALDQILAGENQKVDLVLQLDVTEKEVRDRIEQRAKVSGREDDQKAAIVERRIGEYFSKTIHVLPYYQQQNKVVSLNGIGDIDQIFDQISSAIDARI